MSHRNKNKQFHLPGAFKSASSDGSQSVHIEHSLSTPYARRTSMSAKERHKRLLEAAETGDGDTVQYLLTKGFDAGFYDKPTVTPLVRASFQGHLEVVGILLDARAFNLERGVNDALTWALFSGQPAVADLLLQHCSDHLLWLENAPPPPPGMQRIKPIDYVKFLLQDKKLTGSADVTEDTLSWAKANGYTKIAEIIQTAGVGSREHATTLPLYGNADVDRDTDVPDYGTSPENHPTEAVYQAAVVRDVSKTQHLLEGNTPHHLFRLYFRRHPLGSQKYDRIFLSTLPPRDRVEILERVVEDDPKNEIAYDRLGLAYLKDGRRREAHKRLERAMSEGNIPTAFFNQMTENIRMMHTSSPNGYGSTTNYVEARSTLARFVDREDKVNYRDFLSIYETFCALCESEQKP